jgi:predicted transcriptional regulator
MAKPQVFTRIVSAQLPRTEADRLAQIARASDRSLSAEIRRAVRHYLERTETSGGRV